MQPNYQNLVFVLLALVMLATGPVGCDGTGPDYPDRQPPAGILGDPQQVEAGRELFLAKCASCHGKADEGRSPSAASFQPPAPDFTEERYAQADPAYLFWRIETGKTVEPFRSQGSVMPAWGPHFSDQQVWQLVAYLMQRAN